MARFIFGLILCLLCAASTHTEARFPRGVASASCPQATDNGCAAANQNGSFQSASLLTSAQQSGQNSLLPTRAGGLLTLNIPAVDYPIGPDKTLTPKDPRTLCDAVCCYVGPPPNDGVDCVGSASVVNETLDNYDFSGAKIGKSCLILYWEGPVLSGSTATITNSYFCVPPSSARSQTAAMGFTGNWNIVYKNNQCDGATADLGSDECLRDDGDNAGTSLDIEYSDFINQGVVRVINGLQYMTLAFKYNFVQGLNDLNFPSTHGEVSLRNCSSGGKTNCNSSENYEGNFIIWNRLAVHSQNNATFFPSTGESDGLTLSATRIVNNIAVTNQAADGINSVGNGLFGQRAASLGVVTIVGNWLDASGSGDCGISGATNGGNTVGAQQTGTVLNITSLDPGFNNFPIEPGWQAFHSAYTTATITSFGTGTGNTGTYNMGGPSQSAGPDSSWTVVPGFTSATLTGNYLLNDPGHTGVPTAIGYSGPQMAATNCF